MLLASAADMSDAELTRDLSQLAASGLLFQRGAPPDAKARVERLWLIQSISGWMSWRGRQVPDHTETRRRTLAIRDARQAGRKTLAASQRWVCRWTTAPAPRPR